MAMALMAIEADSRGFISCVKVGIEGGRGEMGVLMAARLCVRFWWSRIDQGWHEVGRRRPGRCPMKVTTPGSLTGWAHLSARGRRRPNRTSGATAKSDKHPGLTDRVGPPVSEREATAKTDKRSRRRSKWTSGGVGPWLGWKIREEARPKPFLGLKSNRVKENQFQLIYGLK
jgi:hypothetical protein